MSHNEWLGWYFSPADERLAHGDGRPIRVGITHTVQGPPVLCSHGLHASPSVWDALVFARSYNLWRVRLAGQSDRGKTKSCATERTYLARLNARPLYARFARKCALAVVHLWDAPDVVRSYLSTGAEGIRLDALGAARAAVERVTDNVELHAALAAEEAANKYLSHRAVIRSVFYATWADAHVDTLERCVHARAAQKYTQMLEQMALAAISQEEPAHE